MKYSNIQITADSSAQDIAPFAMAVHELLGLPVTMRSLNNNGLRIEKGKILDNNYTGPVLETVLKENKMSRIIPTNGKYAGIPVIVVPIRNKEGYGIAAIGVVEVVKQVQECVRARVTVP
jgi:hypothetical protein